MAVLEVIGVLLVIFIFVTVLIYAIVSGLLEPISIKTLQSYNCKGYYVYKAYVGDYSNAGPQFTEASSIEPDLECAAIYYDDPKRVPKEKCRYTVGALIKCDMELRKRETIISNYKSHGYKVKEIDNIGQAVYCTFPYVTHLSVILGVARVYPEMSKYIIEKRLDARLFMEHYAGGLIHFIAPLERHDEFMLPGIDNQPNKQTSEGGAVSQTTNFAVVPPAISTEGDLPKVEQLTEVGLSKPDEDSVSSASSFEEVRQEDCSTGPEVMKAEL